MIKSEDFLKYNYNSEHSPGMVWRLMSSVICILFSLSIQNATAEPVKVSKSHTVDGKLFINMENDFYKLQFDIGRGGRCSSFVIKGTERELVYNMQHGGFFMEHWASQTWPGEFYEAPYQYEIIGDGKEQMSLMLWCISTGKGNPQNPALAGLRVQKAVTLYANEKHIDVEIAIINPTEVSKSVSLWIQQGFYLGGQYNNTYYRPSTRGIRTGGTYDALDKPWGENWVRDPVEGWTAALNPNTHEGTVFILDYNYLSALCNALGASNVEWFTDQVLLPPGEKWTTQYTVIPIDGFKGFAHASRRLIADIEVRPDKDRVVIEHFIRGGIAPLADITLRTSVHGVRSKNTITLPDVTFRKIGFEIISKQLEMDGPQKEPMVIYVETTGKNWQERYEFSYEGEFAIPPLPGYPATPEYERPKPKKEKIYLKPDFDKLRSHEHNKVNILLFYGLYTNWYRIEETIAGMGKCQLKVSNALTGGAEYFPGSYQELFGYDIIVLSDVNAGALSDFGMEMVLEFVRNGGGLLVLGGPFTFGQGDYKDTQILSLLPVELKNFDLKWEEKGALLKKATEHEILKGVDLSSAPMVYWIHDAKPKVGAKVVLYAGERPVLVVWEHGKGRVAAFLGSPLGVPIEGQVPFWNWPGWNKLMQNMIQWLKKGGEER